jgi:hypothetical protein
VGLGWPPKAAIMDLLRVEQAERNDLEPES